MLGLFQCDEHNLGTILLGRITLYYTSKIVRIDQTRSSLVDSEIYLQGCLDAM